MTTTIGYCTTCQTDPCPHPQIKSTPDGNCSEWTGGTKSDLKAKLQECAKARWAKVKILSAPAVKSIAKVPALKSGNDAAAAKQLTKLFTDAQTGMRKIVALGLFAWEMKEQQLKHGEFGPWLAAHAPKLCRLHPESGKPQVSHALHNYMTLTKSVLEAVGIPSISKYLGALSNLPTGEICHHGKLLLLPAGKVPADLQPLREKICTLVDGKTQRQLFMEFKQSEDDKPKRGRLKGHGGASKAQREAAQQITEKARLEAMDLRAVETAEWLTEVADDKHLGLISDLSREQLLVALDTAAGYLRRLASRSQDSSLTDMLK